MVPVPTRRMTSSRRYSANLATVDAGDDQEGESTTVAWELAEVLGWGLALIFAVLILTGLVLAVVFLVTVGSEPVIGFTGFNASALGEAFEQGAFWALPELSAVFILGSLGLAWWQIESWTSDEGGLEQGGVVHIRRARILVRAILFMSVLCVVGGLLSAVGHSLATAPAVDWSSFVGSIGYAIASILLGGIGVYASARLLRPIGTLAA